MRKLFTSLACLAVVASCASAAPRATPVAWKTDTELVTNMGSQPDTIDPQKVSFANEMSIVGMLYEPLLTWDAATLTLVPAAARALPRVSGGGRVYTYVLRDGLTYSDGARLTAERFADAFVRLCDPRVGGEYAFLAFPIVGCEASATMDPKRTTVEALAAGRAAIGVRALDALTIEFTLREPFAAFPQVTAMPAAAPVRVEDVARWETLGRTVHDASAYVGNGPFVMAEWSVDRMVFARNDRYRLPVRLARWTKLMVEDRDTSRALYDAGLLDVVGVGPRDAAEREALLARPDIAVTLGTCTRYVGFNVQRPPFDDANVRMAFAKAIDREQYVRDVAIGTHPAPSFVTHDFPGHTHTDRTQDFDPNEARRLLASSKYGAPVDGRIGGVDVRFTFTTAGLASPARTRVEWLIAEWRANLGVAVRADPVDTTTYGPGPTKKAQAQPLLRDMSWCADYPDGEAWYSDFTKDGPAARALLFDDPEYDAIVARARSETDPLARERIYDGASYRLSQQAPGAWLYWSQYWMLVNPSVSGYTLSSFDWDFSQFALTRIVGVRR